MVPEWFFQRDGLRPHLSIGLGPAIVRKFKWRRAILEVGESVVRLAIVATIIAVLVRDIQRDAERFVSVGDVVGTLKGVHVVQTEQETNL